METIDDLNADQLYLDSERELGANLTGAEKDAHMAALADMQEELTNRKTKHLAEVALTTVQKHPLRINGRGEFMLPAEVEPILTGAQHRK